MKKIGRLICLTTVAVIALPCWTTTATAQTTLPDPVYPVIHDKAWYDDPANVAPFTWTDEQGVQHENKISDPATNPLHIIALLSYVYTNPKIPGTNYAIPDSAGMQNIYEYIPSGLANYDGKPVRSNNLDTRIDYTRNVRDNYYTGNVQDNWGNHNNYMNELRLDANRNGLQLWAENWPGNNPFFTQWEELTEYTKDSKNNILGQGTHRRPIVAQPIEHGLTVFLVKMKDSYVYSNTDHKPVLGSADTWDTSRNQYGVINSLYNSINNEIESVRLLTNAVRVEDAESKANHNSGTLFSVDEPDMNRFYFIAKGSPRQSVKMPTKPLFEEFSPISSLTDGWTSYFYNELMEGKIYTMMHDCSSVPEQAHAFSMHGLDQSIHRNIEGVCFWVPDYRMEYWEYDKGAYSNYNPSSREGFGRDLFKLYGDGGPGPVYRVIRYFNYNPQHAPSLALYTCKLAAEAQPYSGTSEYEHPYNVTLDWSTTVSRIASSNDAIPEDFDVYLVEDGVRQPNPLFSFVYGQNGYCQVNFTNNDLAQGESPASKSRTYEHNYQVPQYEDHGYWLTYQIVARVHSESETESFFNVLSNTDRVWIPPYQGSGAVKLQLAVNTSSEYDREKEVNRYVNTISITNNPGNPLLMGDVFGRPGYQGWNPNKTAPNNHAGWWDDVPQGGASWQYADNNLGSEILIYRFETAHPEVKTQVARVYFNNIVGGRFRFAVGRRNQAESAKEGEYIYTNDDLEGIEDNARPWMQSCDADSYNAGGNIPFTYNHGYALGTDPKGDPNYYYTKGLLVTDVFEASTASNEHPSQYGYVAEFHKYSNPNASNWGYQNVDYMSNEVTVDVYKSNSESSEYTFTKNEVDNGDTMHELELGYKAGLTVNNMLYLPEITKYQLYSRNGEVASRAERDTPNTYLVYAGNRKVDEPGQFQSVVTIPDNSREPDNLNNVFYVPVITAQLPERANWMTGDGSTIVDNSYGSDFHGTNNCKVTLEEDKEHTIAAQYVPDGADIAYGSATEHSVSGNNHYYGCYMKIGSGMSSNDLEVYGVRVWRVRNKDKGGNPEDELVNAWFKDEGYAFSQDELPQSCYFVIGDFDDNNGNLTVSFKDVFPGPDVETFQSDTNYQPTYIVHFYARLKNTSRRGVGLMADDEPQEKIYYVSGNDLTPSFTGDIPTAIPETVTYGDVESITYVDGLGRMSSRPFKGLNIVVVRRSDGTVTKTKMILK